MPEAAPKRVLIVDDEMDMRIFMKTLFETSGWQPVVTRDGAQGLAQAQQSPPDLIVLDVMMPGEGGALMYRAVKRDARLAKVPVIMLSAVKPEVFHHYLKMLNARSQAPIPPPDAYMEKPPETDALLDLANRLVTS
ncbi:MAG: response regulator [Desulfosarcinaceae bacterium]|nr:response regulator [Desulfosarcinaceae bacterium]